MSDSVESTRASDFTKETWAELGAYLERSDLSLLSDSDRTALRSDWLDITKQEDRLDDALMIGIVGGTGVGKSTFINALAGADISRSSDRRPTTSRVVVYRHVKTDIPGDIPTGDLAQPEVLHEKPGLTKIIVLDFPDFDSAELTHQDIIKRFLPYLDVLLIVVDDVKYADRRLYALLRQLDHSRANLFTIFNKIDRLRERYGDRTLAVIEEIQADFRDKLLANADLRLTADQQFAISAQTVLAARRQQSTSSDDALFEQVESLLAGFQEEKYRRAVKERNIDSRKDRLAEMIETTALGSDNRSVLQETQQLVDQWRDDLSGVMSGIPVEILTERERRGLRRARMRRVGSQWGLPFSLMFTALGELRRVRTKTLGSDPAEIANRIHQHYRAFYEALGNLRARFASELVGTSMADKTPVIADAREIAPSTREMAQRFYRELHAETTPPSRFHRSICHVPAMGMVFIGFWRCLHPILESFDATSGQSFFGALLKATIGFLSPTFLLGIVFAVLVAYLATGLVLWLHEVQGLDKRIQTAEVQVREAARVYGGEVVGKLDGSVKELKTEFDALNALIA